MSNDLIDNESQDSQVGQESEFNLISPPTAYELYYRHKSAEILSTDPSTERSEISTIVLTTWDNLSSNERAAFKAEADKEKEKYAKAKADLKAMRSIDEPIGSPVILSDADSPPTSNGNKDTQDDELVWGDEEAGDEIGVSTTVSSTSTLCSRFGCANPTKLSTEWDNEFCSSDCVIKHCKFVFDSYFAPSS